MEAKAMILVTLLALFLVSPLALATDLTYCDKNANYEVKVKGIEISPNPVARGQPATISVSASTEQNITDGKLVIDVTYFGFPVHSETDDLCSKTSCPVSIGDFVIAHSQHLPVFTPPGIYYLTMKIEDTSNKQLSCINFDFSIGFGSGSSVAAS